MAGRFRSQTHGCRAPDTISVARHAGKKWGRVLNLLNVYAKTPDANTAPTSISRAAGMALTKVLSAEGAADNILVNALLIGFLESDKSRRRHVASGSNDSLDEFIAKAGERLPMGRMGRAEECADLALFLASERGSYITGCAINMDGGCRRWCEDTLQRDQAPRSN